MAESDVRRKAELVIVGELKNFTNKTNEELKMIGLTRAEADALAAWAILTSRGGTDSVDKQAAVESPPFVVAEAQDGQELIAEGVARDGLDNTWQINMGVAYVTELYDALPEDHSASVQLLRKGLQAIRPGYEPDLKFRLHGINILGLDDFEDAEKRARGDVYSLVIGCSG
jgi:hypothetical protein